MVIFHSFLYVYQRVFFIARLCDFLQCSSKAVACLAQVLRCWKGLSDPQSTCETIRAFDALCRRKRGAISPYNIWFVVSTNFFSIPELDDGPNSLGESFPKNGLTSHVGNRSKFCGLKLTRVVGILKTTYGGYYHLYLSCSHECWRRSWFWVGEVLSHLVSQGGETQWRLYIYNQLNNVSLLINQLSYDKSTTFFPNRFCSS